MFSLNRATILGNLTKDPEMRYTPNGQAVTSFSVATNRRWTDKNTGEAQEVAEFHDVVAWGKLAEIASQFLKKGQPAYIEGRIQTRNWEGQDGVKRYKTEIIADNVIALGAKGAKPADYDSSYSQNPVEEVAKSDEKKPAKNDSDEEIDIEDIPF